nr:reverse transcriptase domain-containing protein [Tanacetum cinerariifolium]
MFKPPLVGPNFQNPNPDLRLMEELLQAPINGLGDAIVVPLILANQFKLKIGLLNLVTAIAFHGFENDDPHSHIRRFMKITQTIKLNNDSSDVVKLLLFPFVLEGATRTSSKLPSPVSLPFDPPKWNPHQPPIPYPSRLNKEKLQDKSDIQKLMLPKLVPTRMTLELANQSISYPTGIAEDVFVQVGKFTFPTDFIVVDYDFDPRVPLILGRPFLRTARALVDVYKEKLILRDGDENLIFHVYSTSKHPHNHGNESINMINFIDITCEDRFKEVLKIKKSNHPFSGNPTPSSDSMVETLSLLPTPFEYSDSLLEETDTLFSHSDGFLRTYEAFYFDFEEKSSGSTTFQSDHSLPNYEAFCFDVDPIKEKSSGSATSHSDLSLLEYESFHFYLSIDQLPPADRSDFYHKEFTDELAHIISLPEYENFYFNLENDPGELTSHLKENISNTSIKNHTVNEFNDFPLLLSDCESSFSEEFF